jgi:tryptophanyl-tRNA synthetase
MTKRVLTGIKPTGVPHLGNYVGAIRPALRRATDPEHAFFFIADYHALNQVQDPALFNEYSYVVAATWLACGLDPAVCSFYRQSDIRETFELTTILSAFTPKGWMNKAHAYKAAVDTNREAGESDDAGVNMGLFTYPMLMAADILVFRSEIVPVGKDQVQHVEIARDIALRLNRDVGTDVLTLPDYELPSDAEAIPGLDGRKMSKSYNNTIPLFATAKEWKKGISSIKTDSSGRDEPKVAEGSAVYEIYAALATGADAAAMKASLEAGGMGWGDAKAELLGLIETEFTGRTETYDDLMAHPERIDEILEAGATRVRPLAESLMEDLRRAIGRGGSVRRSR